MNPLFSGYSLKNLVLRNRIVMSPMCMYKAGEDGLVTPWHHLHYQTRAQGGVGLIIQEATAVEPRGRISAQDLGIWDDSHVSGLTELVWGIKALGAASGIQIAHAGRKCTVPGEDIIAPSPLCFDPEDPKYGTPREMGVNDVEIAAHAFRMAAERALEAGYDLLEIHGAHGYLISEFLSPLTNHRQDSLGGSRENRTGMLKEVVRQVRAVWPEDRVLALRISARDYQAGGNEPEDLAAILNLVKNEGIDLVHVSTGGVVTGVTVPSEPGYQIEPAAIIKKETGLPVIAGGLITRAHKAGEIISRHKADLVFFGRELLRNPYFPLLAAREEKEELPYWPEPYLRSR